MLNAEIIIQFVEQAIVQRKESPPEGTPRSADIACGVAPDSDTTRINIGDGRATAAVQNTCEPREIVLFFVRRR
jgi:hypothetical protein